MKPLSQIFCAKSSYSDTTKIHETRPAQHIRINLSTAWKTKKIAELKSKLMHR
jgi:hypothetical protein